MTPVLEVNNLSVRYAGGYAVRRVSFDMCQRETLAIIGESGSGKTTLALSIACLLPRAASAEGSVRFQGEELLNAGRDELRHLRGKSLSFVPQDAMAALNPLLRVGRQVSEVFEVHERAGGRQAREAACDALRRVRIREADRVMRLHPHELSGGMRQRVMIAIALALNPALVIADEPTTALDVSTQAEILRLVAALRGDTDASMIWITHDIGVAAEIAERVAVMYGGSIVESGPAEVVLVEPHHPYTRGLLDTRHDLRRGIRGARLYQIGGSPPGVGALDAGCRFRERCARASDLCETCEPELAGSSTHKYACHHPLPLAAEDVRQETQQ